MTFGTIHGYGDFCAALVKAGFSIGGDNSEGIFTLCGYFGGNIRWHTGNPDTDPWAWRMRVLTEESGIGYGKLFFQKGGFMTEEWAPYFITAKRDRQTYEDVYLDGHMSLMERSICKYVEEKGEAALHEIKAAVGGKGLETAISKLQTGMFLTISGEAMRLSKENTPYGWPVTTFRLTEAFWGQDVMEKAHALSAGEAKERIMQRVRELNPAVEPKALERFLR